jgi:uncharacterized protein
LNLERNGTLKKQKKHLFLQKNQLTMNNFRKKMVYLQCCSKQAADMLRKQPCLVRTENLDNSLYTRTKTEVVHPTVYYCIHSASAGWVSTYTHWCELIFILCVQVVQNLQNRMKLVRTFFVPKNEITNKQMIITYGRIREFILGIITNKNYKNMKKIYLIMILFFATASGVFAQTANIVTLTLKAKSGEAEAQNALGEAYYDGKGVTENLPEAVKWFTRAAEQENVKAENNLGNCYYYGNGVYKDYGEAVKWYTKAAEQGYAEAQNSLGYYYEINELNPKKAVEWYTKAAEQGLPMAQCNLGICYKYGNGVEKNFEEAVKWYTKAANQEYAQAQYNLALSYDKGEGVAKNDSEAMKWYLKAVKNNYPQAAYYYGAMLLEGNKQKGITKNIPEGVKYLRKAADLKNLDAINSLVGAYYSKMTGENDFGISKYLSYADFVKYIKIGAEEGDQNMKIFLTNLPNLKSMIAQEKSLVAKYGQRAYDNIKKGKVYIGMPEGILTAYKTFETDGSRYQMYKYNGPYRDLVGTYKQYIPSYALRLVNLLGKVFPRIVKVRNGKVTNVIY